MTSFAVVTVGVMIGVFTIGFLTGILIGCTYRDIMNKLNATKEQPSEVGVTPASYGKVDEFAANQKDIGIVEPLTPQQLEWKEEADLRKMNENVQVKNGRNN